MLPLAVGVAGPLVDELRDGGFTSGDVPDEVDLFFEGFAALIVLMAALILLQGATMLAAGVADLVLGRRTVEGRVLRVRDRVGRTRTAASPASPVTWPSTTGRRTG